MKIGDKVRFRDETFEGDYAYYFLPYRGHQFIVTGFMPDEGFEFSIDGPAVEFKNPGVVEDHVGLLCTTGPVKVNGYVHDWRLELVQ